MARIHQCDLTGIDLEAFRLFQLFTGGNGPASEFQFYAQPSKAEWVKLALYLERLRDRAFKNQLK